MYADELTLREARALYFEDSGFDESTYTSKWLELPVGPFRIKLPSPHARRIVVARHDAHHILAGFGTTWRGEGRISAFELAAGCGPYWFGWVVNSQVLALGGLLFPRACFEGWVRGRHADTLYQRGVDVDDELLGTTVGELRKRLRLDRPAPEPSLADRLTFVGAVAASIVSNLTLLALPFAALVAIYSAVVC